MSRMMAMYLIVWIVVMAGCAHVLQAAPLPSQATGRAAVESGVRRLLLWSVASEKFFRVSGGAGTSVNGRGKKCSNKRSHFYLTTTYYQQMTLVSIQNEKTGQFLQARDSNNLASMSLQAPPSIQDQASRSFFFRLASSENGLQQFESLSYSGRRIAVDRLGDVLLKSPSDLIEGSPELMFSVVPYEGQSGCAMLKRDMKLISLRVAGTTLPTLRPMTPATTEQTPSVMNADLQRVLDEVAKENRAASTDDNRHLQHHRKITTSSQPIESDAVATLSPNSNVSSGPLVLTSPQSGNVDAQGLQRALQDALLHHGRGD